MAWGRAARAGRPRAPLSTGRLRDHAMAVDGRGAAPRAPARPGHPAAAHGQVAPAYARNLGGRCRPAARPPHVTAGCTPVSPVERAVSAAARVGPRFRGPGRPLCDHGGRTGEGPCPAKKRLIILTKSPAPPLVLGPIWAR